MNRTGIPSWSFENVGKSLIHHDEPELQPPEEKLFIDFSFIIQTFEEMFYNIF